MRLKFKRAVSVGRTIYHAGTEHDIKDLHAAETYLAHGYADLAGPDKEAGKEIPNPKPQIPSK